MFEEMGNDQRWLLQLNDFEKLIFQLILCTIYWSNGIAPDDPRYYKVRYALRHRTSTVATALEHIKAVYPKLISKDKKLSLLNAVAYRNTVDEISPREVEVEKEREVEKEIKNPQAGLFTDQERQEAKKNKDDLKGIVKGIIDSKAPRKVRLSSVEVKCGDQVLDEPAKHKLWNRMQVLIEKRGWHPQALFEVFEICAVKVRENGKTPESLYPYFEKTISTYLNEHAETVSAQSKRLWQKEENA